MTHPSLADFAIIDILQLIRSENVGPVTFFQLVKRFGSPRAALDALPELARRGGMKRKLVVASAQAVEQEMALTEKFGACFVVYGDAQYPALLMDIPDAPPVLTLWGSSQHWQSRALVGMVGSRNASTNGCAFARHLARECAANGLGVVSGLARGIDTAAHQGSLEAGTIGVIAGGINNVYPPENKVLYSKMAELGAIISENPFGASPQARSFPSRNRIIAGMCEGLVVVEAAPKSGSLITARYALDYHREVMAVPGSPMDPRSAGANGLIKQGAVMVESVEDIISAIRSGLSMMRLSAMPQGGMEESEGDAEIFANFPMEEGLDVGGQILEKLSTTPIQLDELARDSHIPIAQMQSALLELELAGKIARYPGGNIVRVYEEFNEQAALL